MQSLKFAVRQLKRSPAFAVTVAVTLAFSTGANTAIFSIVDALLLKDPPYAQPDRIGTLFARTTGAESSDIRRNVDGEQWELMRDHVQPCCRRYRTCVQTGPISSPDPMFSISWQHASRNITSMFCVCARLWDGTSMMRRIGDPKPEKRGLWINLVQEWGCIGLR